MRSAVAPETRGALQVRGIAVDDEPRDRLLCMSHHPVCTQYVWCRSRHGISLPQTIGVCHTMQASDRYPATLLAAFSAVWLGLAIAPSYRQDWLLENVIVFIGVPALVLAYHRLRFSNFAYTCLFVFLVLHESARIHLQRSALARVAA